MAGICHAALRKLRQEDPYEFNDNLEPKQQQRQMTEDGSSERTVGKEWECAHTQTKGLWVSEHSPGFGHTLGVQSVYAEQCDERIDQLSETLAKTQGN